MLKDILKERPDIIAKNIEKKIQMDGDFKYRINNIKNQISGQKNI